MRLAILVAPPWLATLVFWSTFVACIDAPLDEDPPVARVVIAWDPLACGEPHRVAVELEDEAGARASTSTPCTTGGATLDLPHLGVYRGRIYAWTADEQARAVTSARLAVDASIVRWWVATP